MHGVAIKTYIYNFFYIHHLHQYLNKEPGRSSLHTALQPYSYTGSDDKWSVGVCLWRKVTTVLWKQLCLMTKLKPNFWLREKFKGLFHPKHEKVNTSGVQPCRRSEVYLLRFLLRLVRFFVWGVQSAESLYSTQAKSLGLCSLLTTLACWCLAGVWSFSMLTLAHSSPEAEIWLQEQKLRDSASGSPSISHAAGSTALLDFQ